MFDKKKYNFNLLTIYSKLKFLVGKKYEINAIRCFSITWK